MSAELHWRLDSGGDRDVWLTAQDGKRFHIYAITFSNLGQSDAFRGLLEDGVYATADGIEEAVCSRYEAALKAPRRTTRVSR